MICKEVFFVLSKFASCTPLKNLLIAFESHLISTPVTMPTLNLSLYGISYSIYGTLQEKTDAKAKEITMDCDDIQAHNVKIKTAYFSAF